MVVAIIGSTRGIKDLILTSLCIKKFQSFILHNFFLSKTRSVDFEVHAKSTQAYGLYNLEITTQIGFLVKKQLFIIILLKNNLIRLLFEMFFIFLCQIIMV